MTRASARRWGLASTPVRPRRSSSSQPRESVISSSTRGSVSPGSPGSNSRSSPLSLSVPPARSGANRSAHCGAKAPLRTSSSSSRERKLAVSSRVALLPQRGPPLAEDRHVGVAEAVDRLELVADREQVVALQRLEDVELEPVRVLELVDHDQAEALGPALAIGGVSREEIADAELEVLEVEPGAGGLGLGVGGAEAGQQVGDLDQREARVVVGAALAVGGPRGAVRGARLLLERLRALLELAGRERGRHRNAWFTERPVAALQRVERLLELLAVARGARQRAASARAAASSAGSGSGAGGGIGSTGRVCPRERSVEWAARTRSRSPAPKAAATSTAAAPRAAAQSSNARS